MVTSELHLTTASTLPITCFSESGMSTSNVAMFSVFCVLYPNISTSADSQQLSLKNMYDIVSPCMLHLSHFLPLLFLDLMQAIQLQV